MVLCDDMHASTGGLANSIIFGGGSVLVIFDAFMPVLCGISLGCEVHLAVDRVSDDLGVRSFEPAPPWAARHEHARGVPSMHGSTKHARHRCHAQHT